MTPIIARVETIEAALRLMGDAAPSPRYWHDLQKITAPHGHDRKRPWVAMAFYYLTLPQKLLPTSARPDVVNKYRAMGLLP